MELKSVVASYANKAAGKVEIDLDALMQDSEARQLLVTAVLSRIRTKRDVCIFIPAPVCPQNRHLFINELALKLRREVLVTGEIQRLRGALIRCPSVKEVVIITGVFNKQKDLATQVAAIKAARRKAMVLNLITHSKKEQETFAAEQEVEVSSLVCTEEI